MRNKKERDLNKIDEVENEAMKFVLYGIAAYAICLIDQSGILDSLLKGKLIRKEEIKKFKNYSLMKSALDTLIGADIVKSYDCDSSYSITEFGRSVAKKIGLLTVPLIGYRKLICNQLDLLENPENFRVSDIDFAGISLASIDFGEEYLDPLLMSIFKKIYKEGRICDLGCGTGEKLLKICNIFKASGIGIERDQEVINESKKFLMNEKKIEIIQGDIFNLTKAWEDTSIVMASFVLHDIASVHDCSEVLYSYHSHFPNMEYLVIVDIVSRSPKLNTIMPGFDYIHGLQGIVPRNYEETLLTFKSACYKVKYEYPVPKMPNTFVWVLIPKRQSLE